MQAKPVSATRITTYHAPLPGEANNDGNFYGGNLMRLLDSVGFFPAVRHARCRLVTAACNVIFRTPIKIGEMVICHASINAVWNSAMEVGIRIEAEEPYSGAIKHAATCFLTYVSVDDGGKASSMPPLILETEEDKRRMAEATRRIALSRLESRHDPASLSGLHLALLPGDFAVCQLSPDTNMPGVCLPDLSGLPMSSFVSLSRTQEELSLILEEEAARALESMDPSMQAQYGYACIQVREQDIIGKVGMLASLSSLLASVQVPLVTVSTYGTFCLLVEKELLPKVAARLRTAGHTINGMP